MAPQVWAVGLMRAELLVAPEEVPEEVPDDVPDDVPEVLTNAS